MLFVVRAATTQAPEVKDGSQQYGPAADVYSLGVTVLDLASGGSTNVSDAKRLVGHDSELLDFIQQCTHK